MPTIIDMVKKTLSLCVETKKRISETLKGRKMSLLERENHSLGNTKKVIIDCYDYYNHNLISSFVGQNKME